jgi:hypothetical protein
MGRPLTLLFLILMASPALPALAVRMEVRGRKVLLAQLDPLVSKVIREMPVPKGRLGRRALIRRSPALRVRLELD